MKKNYYQFIFAILFLMGLQFNSALADGKIKIQLKQPPPNLMGVKDLWKMDITNNTRENINIYLTGTAAESKKGLIVSGKSKVLTISPGTKSYDYNDFKSGGEVNWKDKSIQEVLLRTGNVPEGEYTICVTALYENNEVADQESCIEQSIKLEGSITLISPDDGAEIDSKQPVLFSWTPLVPKPSGGVTYRLKVWQLMQGQNSTTAMRTNQPIVTKDVDNITQIMVTDLNAAGPCPPFICQFTWNVQALIQGHVVENYNSDASTFNIITKDISDKGPPLIAIEIKITFGKKSGGCKTKGICDVQIKITWAAFKPEDNTGKGIMTAIDDKTLEIIINKDKGLTPAGFEKYFSTGNFVLEEDYTFGNDIKEMLKMNEDVTIKAGSYKVKDIDGLLTMRFPSQGSTPFTALVAMRMGEPRTIGNCKETGACHNEIYEYKGGRNLTEREMVMELTLSGDLLKGQFINEPPEKGNEFPISQDIVLDKNTSSKLGLKTVTILPGNYKIDYTDNKNGVIYFKVKEKGNKSGSDVIYQSAFLDPGPPEKMKCNARGTDCITTSVLILPQKTTLSHDENLKAATIKINAILDGIRSSGEQSGKRPCLYDSKYGYLLIWVSDTPPEKPTNMLITDPDKIAEFLKIKGDKPDIKKSELVINGAGDKIWSCVSPGKGCSGSVLVDAANTPIHDEVLIEATAKINAILSEYAAKTPRPDTKLCILKIPAGLVLAWVSTSGNGEGERITITPDSKQYEDIINESLGIKGNNDNGEKPPLSKIRFYFNVRWGVWKDTVTCISGWSICSISIGFKDDKLIANMGTGTVDGDIMKLEFTQLPAEMRSEFEIGKDILVEGYTDSNGKQIYIKKGVYKVEVKPGIQQIKIVSFTVKN